MNNDRLDIAGQLVATGIDQTLAAQLQQLGHYRRFKKDDMLFREDSHCESFILVVSGRLKVRKLIPNGHEIVLYQIEAGQECSLSCHCLLAGHNYQAEAIAESNGSALMLPRDTFLQLLAQQPLFTSLVFKNSDREMSELLNVIQDLAFDHMDHRLAAALLKQGLDHNSINTTHQQLAQDLGTAREVVSRLLKEFEHRGWVKLHRGRIEFTNKQALARL